MSNTSIFKGGTTIAQDPRTVAASVIPQAAIDTGKVDKIFRAKNVVCPLFMIYAPIYALSSVTVCRDAMKKPVAVAGVDKADICPQQDA